MTSFLSAATLFVAALAAGAINSVAGGGSFLTFPSLIFSGVPAINANTTSTVALWPGSVASIGAYRRELSGQRGLLLPLTLVSLAGGVLGAILLLRTPSATFERLIPFLLLSATLLFAFSGQLTRLARGGVKRRIVEQEGAADGLTSASLAGTPARRRSWPALVALCAAQLVVAIYGGFFGGGIGIVMLAMFGLEGMTNIHAMNALKVTLASVINGVAVVTFIVAGSIYWPQALLMLVAAVVGGYGGAAIARRLDPRLVRGVVILVGAIMTVVFLVR